MVKVPSDQTGNFIDHVKIKQALPAAHDDSGEAAVIFPQIPSESFDATAAFEEPEILPRIGDEYQAELPPYAGESGHNSYLRNCVDRELRSHPYRLFIGLPLPMIWIDFQRDYSSKTVSHSENSNGGIEPKRESPNLQAGEKTVKFGERALVPGLLGESWSDAEKASFLLGLYIFEKNFVEMRQFMETKCMGAILSYYYGKFYGSEEYQRWSECFKTKGKKCVCGRRIFSGLRLQELLSRILPKVSEECKSTLLEVTKAFGDEKMSLAAFVSSLKAMVGMNDLVEAVGIGTGKQDLTRMVLEPSRSSRAILFQPEMPTGKACSSLTDAEIVELLNGGHRLSKARSNDIFWEAVWPRLLARGWHSEQARNKRHGHVVGSGHSLVFLVPGVKKFSRKLVKGEHYYDSVTDVLHRVAGEPGLIKLSADGDENERERDSTGVRKLGEDTADLPTGQQRHHSYLQPRTPNRSVDTLKFMVIDTGLVGGRIRELRTLPSEILNALLPLDCSNEETVHPDIRKSSMPVLKNKQYRKVSKSESSQKLKEAKRSTHEDMKNGLRRHSAENERSSCSTGISHVSRPDLSSSQVSLHQDKPSSNSSSKRSASNSIEHVPIANPLPSAAEPSLENCQIQPSIDLNPPQVAPDRFEHSSLPKSSNAEARTQQQINTIPLRQSTRIRPPTTRALEAVADGYLTAGPKRKRKSRNTTGSHEDLAPRPSQRARLPAAPTESNSSSTGSRLEEAENGALTSDNQKNECR